MTTCSIAAIHPDIQRKKICKTTNSTKENNSRNGTRIAYQGTQRRPCKQHTGMFLDNNRINMYQINSMPGKNVGRKLRDPRNKKKAIAMIARGEPQTKVAAVVGCHASNITHWKKQPEIRKLIEKEVANLVDAIPDAVTYTKQLIADAAEAPVLPHLMEIDLPVIDENGNPTLDREGKEITRKLRIPADAKERANNIKLRGLGYNAARDILTAAGIYATQSESRTVKAILMMGDVSELTPLIRGMLSQMLPAGEANEDDIEPEMDD